MITSRANPLIRRARALREARARKESGQFLVEGVRPVGVAMEAGWEIDALIVAPAVLTSPFGRDLISSFGGRLEEVSPEVLASIAGKEHPQGIVAIADRRQPALEGTRVARLAAALVSPQDAGNVGAVLRTLDAVGGDALFLIDGGVDPYHPTVVRASTGALFTIPVIECGWASFLDWGRATGVHLIGSSSHADHDYRQVIAREPWVLILGSEQKGLSENLQRACDVVVSVPMRGHATSLNLAVAAGILLFEYGGGH